MNNISKKIFFSRRYALIFGLSGLAYLGTVSISAIIRKIQRINEVINRYKHKNFIVDTHDSLGKRAAEKGLLYGSAVRQSNLSTDPQLALAVIRECTILVPEWELKWNYLRPSPTTFDFSFGDWLADFAENNKLLLRGHTLVWEQSFPDWFYSVINTENAQQLLVEHITTVMKHYAGKIHSWDVVNEAIDITSGRTDKFRDSVWLKFLGTDYIELAFRTAAKADPQALLVYNDYGFEYDTDKDAAKRTVVFNLLKDLKSKGVPIHALGIQAHLSGVEPRFNPGKFREFLAKIASLDLKILITEMDVDDKFLPSDIVIRDHTVAGIYEDYLSVILDESAVIALTTWGLSDRYTWLTEYQLRLDHSPPRPLPLDANFKPKLAWQAIARAIDHAPIR